MDRIYFVNVFKGVLLSFLITVVLLMILSLILAYTNVQESIIPATIMIITGVSILIGSSYSNIRLKKNGIFNGAMVGMLYIVIIYLISSLLNCNFGLNVKSIIMIFIALFLGVLGGIIGVNKKWNLFIDL